MTKFGWFWKHLSPRWRLDIGEYDGGRFKYFWRKANAMVAAKEATSSFVSVIDEWEPDSYASVVWHRNHYQEIPQERRCHLCAGKGIIAAGGVERYCPDCDGIGRKQVFNSAGA